MNASLAISKYCKVKPSSTNTPCSHLPIFLCGNFETPDIAGADSFWRANIELLVAVRVLIGFAYR